MAILITFILGYLCIAFEHQLRLNKASTALITGVVCWSFYALSGTAHEVVTQQLLTHMGEISGILFFLLGAMTIVELIDAHNGFEIISSAIKTQEKRKLLWIISFIAFFLSALLDNLTTTIVLISLMSKLIQDKHEKFYFASMIVIAANAGGAWSPIGDVTTTMLWMGGQISGMHIIKEVFLPAIVSVIIPLIAISFRLPNSSNSLTIPNTTSNSSHRRTILFAGVASLLFVPAFKSMTGLPPFMGMLLSLGVMWLLSEIINHQKDTEASDNLSIKSALKNIDTPSILFFLGILISVAALQSVGILSELAQSLSNWIGNTKIIVMSLGGLSAIIDNVPLVAATQGMYSLSEFPMDHPFWIFMAYCTGTGGSMLIIGSAAGVAAMGITKIEFFWYLRKISLWVLLGYLSGALVFLAMSWL